MTDKSDKEEHKKEPPATIEVGSFTRDDASKLARIEGIKLGLPKLSRRQYVERLIKREKERAKADGHWKD